MKRSTWGSGAGRALYTSGTPWRDPRLEQVDPDLVLTGSTLLDDYRALKRPAVHVLELGFSLSAAAFKPERVGSSLYHAITDYAMAVGLDSGLLHIGKVPWRLDDAGKVDRALAHLGAMIGSRYGEAGVAVAVAVDSAAWSYPEIRTRLGAPSGAAIYPWIRDRVDVFLGTYVSAGARVPLLCNSWGPEDAPAFASSDWSRWAGYTCESHWTARETRRGTGESRLASFHRGLAAYCENPPRNAFGFVWRSLGLSTWSDPTRARYLVASSICARAFQLSGMFRGVRGWWEGDSNLDDGSEVDVLRFPRVGQIFGQDWPRVRFEGPFPILEDGPESRTVTIDGSELVPVRRIAE